MGRGKKVVKGLRVHIGLFGRRNVGKSSLLNCLTRQSVSIVSEVAGTTTDPVEKPMELLPLGPVLFIDTAGIDDEGALGELRLVKTRQTLLRADLGIVVATTAQWGDFEISLVETLKSNGVATLVVFNKSDLTPAPSPELQGWLAAEKISWVVTNAQASEGIDQVRQALLAIAPESMLHVPPIAHDLVPPGGTAVLVVPIDKEAPRGRLILPQVQTIRDLLDGDAICVVTKTPQLSAVLANLRSPPDLVVTDSQAFAQVAAETSEEIPLTSFSILFSRLKGDLVRQVRGALTVERLSPGDRVLIAESCTHHPVEEDIGRVKIPHWLEGYVGGQLTFDVVAGHDFPGDLSSYDLVVQCGGCMVNRKAVLNRLLQCQRAGVPMTNYGLVIAFSLGILERTLSPFPDVLAETMSHRTDH